MRSAIPRRKTSTHKEIGTTDAIRIAILSAIISMLALVVSTATVYFTWLRRGQLAMTQPTLVFFGFTSAATGRGVTLLLPNV